VGVNRIRALLDVNILVRANEKSDGPEINFQMEDLLRGKGTGSAEIF